MGGDLDRGCPMRVLDLFSGIGGFALATEWAGGETIAFAEVAEHPSSILASHWPEVPNLGDITKLCRRSYECEFDPDDDLLWCPRCSGEFEQIDFGDCDCIGTDQFTDTHGFPDVIVGGVPCQPASIVGKRMGSSDERWLWPETLRIIGELEPRFVILENPRAILTLDGGRAFLGILGEFANLGYDVQWHSVPASALGAGHKRDRIWILATHSDCARLEGYAGDVKVGGGDEKEGRHPASENLRDREITSPQWYAQSGIRPVVDGIPGRVVREELTSVGNSLVPQVALILMKTVAHFLNRWNTHETRTQP